MKLSNPVERWEIVIVCLMLIQRRNEWIFDFLKSLLCKPYVISVSYEHTTTNTITHRELYWEICDAIARKRDINNVADIKRLH